MVLTGGDYSAADVVKLDQEGEAETLPSLNQGRSRHACGKFTNSDGSIVRYMSQMLYAGQSASPSVPFFSDF